MTEAKKTQPVSSFETQRWLPLSPLARALGLAHDRSPPGESPRYARPLPDPPGAACPTRNLALAALRHFFDALVTRHAVALNPFASVRGRQDARADDSASAGVAWLPGPVKRRGAAGSDGAGGADLHRGPRGRTATTSERCATCSNSKARASPASRLGDVFNRLSISAKGHESGWRR